MNSFEKEKTGPPDINIAGLQIWIHGYQFAEVEDESDANWLRITAYCRAPGACGL